MPTLSIFYGIVIQMFWDDHPPPHFHAAYGGEEAVIEIATSRVMHSKMPPRALRFVLEWTELHRDELMEAWDKCSTLIPPKPIAPLL
jgi:hypothetical protein